MRIAPAWPRTNMAERTPRLQGRLDAEIAVTDESWRLLLLQGAGLVLFGVAAAILSKAMPLAPSALVGWLLLMTGLFRLASGFGADIASGHWSSMLLSAFVILYGASLAFYPRVTAFELTLALAIYLIVHALATLVLAASLRRETGRWLAILMGSIVDLVLAAAILAEEPRTYPWVFTLLLGLNLAYAGLALMFAAFGVKHQLHDRTRR
jgi:uncharacterized membrane protein HdeD (DUF308 family)